MQLKVRISQYKQLLVQGMQELFLGIVELGQAMQVFGLRSDNMNPGLHFLQFGLDS